MKVLHSLVRLFSYAFHAFVLFIASAMAVITSASGPQTVNFDALPVPATMLPYGLAALAVVGAIILLLAVRGKAQALYRLWSLLVLALVVRFFFFGSYRFTPGAGDFTIALLVVGCAAIAFFGAGIKVAASHR
ncbi:MAG: hypothetical protein ACE141_00040 [Bryobacteraceae bacterium]